MSCRHSLRSKPIEALISCMITDGPAANRPPHCGLAASFRCVRRLAQGRRSVMLLITRRRCAAAGGTLAAAPDRAQTARRRNWTTLAEALKPTDPPVAAPDIVFRRRRRRPNITWRTSSAMAWWSTSGRPGAHPASRSCRRWPRCRRRWRPRHRRAAAVVRSWRRAGRAGLLSAARDHRAADPARPRKARRSAPAMPVAFRRA